MTLIDDWIDRTRIPENERYATFFFMLHRLDAISQMNWAEQIGKYLLFCTYQGKRYRVTGCSRLGDIWLTADFKRDVGYELRVDVDDCGSWADKP